MVASGGLQHTVQTAQHGEGEDDFALLRLLVVATKQVGDGPEEGGEIGIGHSPTPKRFLQSIARTGE